MSKKPFAVKFTVLLIVLYGIINLISNYIYSFYVSQSGGFFSLSTTGFNTFNQIGFIISSIPIVLLFIAAIILWWGSRLGYWVCHILLVLSCLAAIGGVLYLVANLPKLFTEDLLYLTKNPSATSWLLDNSVENFASVNSLFAYRILIIKSFLKAIIEIISCGSLLYVIDNYQTLYKIKLKKG